MKKHCGSYIHWAISAQYTKVSSHKYQELPGTYIKIFVGILISHNTQTKTHPMDVIVMTAFLYSRLYVTMVNSLQYQIYLVLELYLIFALFKAHYMLVTV